jgi:hypothetical protein
MENFMIFVFAIGFGFSTLFLLICYLPKILLYFYDFGFKNTIRSLILFLMALVTKASLTLIGLHPENFIGKHILAILDFSIFIFLLITIYNFIIDFWKTS